MDWILVTVMWLFMRNFPNQYPFEVLQDFFGYMSSWFKQFYEVRSLPIQTNDRNSNNQIPKDNFILHYLIMQYLSCNNYNNIFSLLFSYLAIILLINFGSTLVTVFPFLFHVFKNFLSLCNVCKKLNNKQVKKGINLI